MRFLILSLLVLFALPASQPALADSDIIKKQSVHGVVETIDKLEAVLTEKGITIFTRVDHTAGAEKVGLEMQPALLLIFGNPKLGTPLMNAEITMGLDLPLKALAYEDADGTVWLAYTDPAAMKARHGVEGQDDVIKTITGALDNFTNAATQ